MKQIATILVLFSCLTAAAQNSDALKNAQQREATQLVNWLEKGDTAKAYGLLDPAYQAKKKKMLTTLSTAFAADFAALPSNAKRYVSLVFPGNKNLFRFRYIGDTGNELQLDVSYHIDAASKIVDLGLITTKSLKKEKATNRTAGYDFH